tara:strand:+ start:1175 stop:2104 length:930 start_codon:yes stop_codon:yes gene_type:complete
MTKNKILVVGGSGFVGVNLINKLKKKNKLFTTHFKQKKIKKIKNVTYYCGNLKKYSFCKKITRNIDTLYMCAAVSSGARVMEENPMIHVNDNIIMNINILKAASKNKVKKFIFISSNTVYPVGKKKMSENDLNYNLFDKYFNVGWMKIFSEKLCEMYKSNMIIIIIRPSNLYGPFDKFDKYKSKVIPSLIRKFEKDKIIEIWGDGKDYKDFLYIDDFIDGLISTVKKIEKFNIINISSGKSISLSIIINFLIKFYKKNKNDIKYNKLMPSMIPFRRIDNKKFLKLNNFKFKDSIYSGLVKTIKWYRKNS